MSTAVARGTNDRDDQRREHDDPRDRMSKVQRPANAEPVALGDHDSLVVSVEVEDTGEPAHVIRSRSLPITPADIEGHHEHSGDEHDQHRRKPTRHAVR